MMDIGIDDLISMKPYNKLLKEEEFLIQPSQDELGTPTNEVLNPNPLKLEHITINDLHAMGGELFYWNKEGKEGDKSVNTYGLHNKGEQPAGGEPMKDVPKGYELKRLQTENAEICWVYLISKETGKVKCYPKMYRQRFSV